MSWKTNQWLYCAHWAVKTLFCWYFTPPPDADVFYVPARLTWLSSWFVENETHCVNTGVFLCSHSWSHYRIERMLICRLNVKFKEENLWKTEKQISKRCWKSIHEAHLAWVTSFIHRHKSVDLTCSVDIFSRADAAGIGADSPAFQQGTEGPRLILWRCTA